MLCGIGYPIELFLNPQAKPQNGEKSALYNKIFFSIANDFDPLNALLERRIIQRSPEEYRRYVRCGRFESEGEVAQLVAAIAQRFSDINEACRLLGCGDLFTEPWDIVASYLLRDAMMLCLVEEEAKAVVAARDAIFSEYGDERQSPTLKRIVGKHQYRQMMKPYRIG